MLDHSFYHLLIVALSQGFHSRYNQVELLLEVVEADGGIDFVPVLYLDIHQRRFYELAVGSFIVKDVEQLFI